MSDSTLTPNQVIYSETVWPSWFAMSPIVLIAPSIALVITPFTDFVVATLAGSVAFVFCLIAVLAMAPKIVVTKNRNQITLHVKNAAIDAKHIGSITVITKDEVRAERGPRLDARSFRVFQTSVSEMVKIHIDDKEDPTPYWLLSTRNPSQLIMALEK